MATLIYPHLFCFSYHRRTEQHPQTDPSWVAWQQQHERFKKVTESAHGEYAGADWDAIYEEKELGDTQGLLLYAAVREEHQPQSLDKLEELQEYLGASHFGSLIS
jgi:hypothetical protein